MTILIVQKEIVISEHELLLGKGQWTLAIVDLIKILFFNVFWTKITFMNLVHVIPTTYDLITRTSEYTLQENQKPVCN